MKDIKSIKAYFERIFPEKTNRFEFIEVSDCYAMVRLIPDPNDLRPGGTISGPTMFELADCAFWTALLYKDPDPMSVTVNCSINFINKPKNANLMARATIRKFGRKLVVGDVELFSENSENIVAQALLTYARAIKK